MSGGGLNQQQRSSRTMTRTTPIGEDDSPLNKRSCTDVPCLLLFIVALGTMGYVVYLAWDTGDPYRLLYGTDSWGNTCGRKNDRIDLPGIIQPNNTGRDLRDFKNIFHYNQLLYEGDVKLCVKSCMTQNDTLADADDLREYHNRTGASYCWYNIEPEDFHDGSGNKDTCPDLPIDKQVTLFNRCFTLGPGAAAAQAADFFLSEISFLDAKCEHDSDLLTNMLNDLTNTWKEISYMCALSIVVSFLVVLLMRFFARIVIWGMFLIIILGSVGGAGYLWYLWYKDKEKLDDIDESATQAREAMKKRVKNWQIYAIVATVVAVIILLILLVMRKRIALVVQLFVEAGKAIAKMPLLLIQPIWTVLALAIFGGGALLLYTFIETAADPKVNSDGFVEYERDEALRWWRWYYVFGLLWIAQFVFACHQMTIAGSVGTWYFTRDKSQLGWPIAASIGRLIRYHLGSVAFGSLIIAIVQFARLVLLYIEKKLAGRGGAVVKYLLKCLSCCLWCLEKVLKFISWNAYIMIAIYGYGFCKAARRAFLVLVSNALRVAAINSVGTFTLFLGKLSCIAVTVCISFYLIKDKADLCYIWTPLLCIALFAFLIAHTFLGIYGMAIDTIFLCFCEDSEQNNGVTKPYYMSKGLMTFVSNASEAMKATKKREQESAPVPAPAAQDENNNNRRTYLRDPSLSNQSLS